MLFLYHLWCSSQEYFHKPLQGTWYYLVAVSEKQRLFPAYVGSLLFLPSALYFSRNVEAVSRSVSRTKIHVLQVSIRKKLEEILGLFWAEIESYANLSAENEVDTTCKNCYNSWENNQLQIFNGRDKLWKCKVWKAVQAVQQDSIKDYSEQYAYKE